MWQASEVRVKADVFYIFIHLLLLSCFSAHLPSLLALAVSQLAYT